MKKSIRVWMAALVALLALAAPMVAAQELQRDDDDYGNDRDYNRSDRVRIDRYLDAELWTNHSDDEFYIGDNVVLNYRINDDAFVAIYSIDTRGRVRLLFPGDPNDDNYVRGGVTYRLPGGNDDYDLSVSGPEGTETIQIIASRERFPIPDWYRNGLVADASDRDDYMDWLNGEYFVRYGGQRFAYDRVRIYINEWEPDYFRPIYHPVYPHWSVCGNVYFDYPWGSSIYIDGIYWGCTPMYVPTILVGWHTVTLYDPWGHCWENDVHIMRHHTVVLDRTVIRTRPTVVSKYKEVRMVGYRDPVSNGYPRFKETVAKRTEQLGGAKIVGDKPLTKDHLAELDKGFTAPTKKYAKSVVPVTKTDRGYEAKGVSDMPDRRSYSRDTYRDQSGTATKSYVPGSTESSRRTEAGKSERSTSGSDSHSGSKSGNVDSRRSDGGNKERPSGFGQKSVGSTSTRSGDSDRKQTVQQPPEKKSAEKSSGSESRKGSDSNSQSKKTEVKSKSDGNSQPQQAPAKSRTDDGSRSKGRR